MNSRTCRRHLVVIFVGEKYGCPRNFHGILFDVCVLLRSVGQACALCHVLSVVVGPCVRVHSGKVNGLTTA